MLREFERAVGGFAVAAGSRGDPLLRGARSREQLALALEQRVLDFDQFLSAASLADLEMALTRSRISLAHAQSRRVVICGDQNAGKSTLMNRLLFQERVMTGELPGLTRDPVREGTLLGGYPYELIDTAGEGDVADELDRRALDLARSAREDGLLLLVVDGSGEPSASDRAIRNDHTIVVRNKSDLPPAAWPDDFPPDMTLSCRADDDVAGVRQMVGAALRRLRGLPEAGPVGGVAALDTVEFRRLQGAHDDALP